MNNLTPLTRPLHSQVTIDPIAKDCPSEGFNYPTFPQLNKQARVQFSQPLIPDPSTLYRLFATANIKGWFVAVTTGSSSSSELIFSSLEHLRSAFNAAKEEDQDIFTPKRTLPLAFGKVNIVTFAFHDTRLLVGLEQGAVAIYDTAALFTPGSGDVQPLRVTQLQSGPLRQIVPNPGKEQNLSSLVAVVGDGKAVLLDMQLESQGGWTASDSLTQPVAVAWSPKGKHIAIGLQTGDILTFPLNNQSAPHKHIPPTADAILVSLNWLGPGHIFRTSYGAKSDSPAKQHIITLDTKSSKATYIAPDHPFPNFDRNQQSAYVLCLPRWDEDASGDGNKSLVVVGDISSVDLEVLGNIGNIWHRQSQENPLTLPLDKAMDDTMLLALDFDLIDTTTGTPVMYAYLNDGTLQGWQVKHSKPYIGMVSAQGLASTFSQSSVQSQESGPKDSDMSGLSSTTETSPFTQSSGTLFGQQTTSSFGQQQSSTFGQSPFNDGTLQGWQVKESKPYIGMVSTQGLAPTFSQLSVQNQESGPKDSDMSGETSPFAQSSGNDALFGQQTTSSFGQQQSSSFGQSPFGQQSSQNTSVFGQSPFGQSTSSAPSAFSPSSTSGPFGQTNTASSSFGTSVANPNDTPSTPPASSSNAFSNIQVSPSAFKPAAGFGAFGSAVASSTSPFFKKPDDKPAPVSAFGNILPQGISTTTPVSTPTFGSPSALGGPKSVFAPASSPSPTVLKPTTSDGFGAFSGSMGGFSAFAGPKKSFSELLKTSDSDPVKPSTPPALFGQQTTPSFGQQQSSTFGQSPFGQQPSQNSSVFGQSSFGQLTSSAPSAFSSSSTSGPFGQTNTATSSFGTSVANPIDTPSTPPASSSNAFSNIQVSPSAFKPAAGFGAFGSAIASSTSPFFKKPDDKPPPVSAFGNLLPQGTSSTTPVSTPTFGSPSALGGPKSVFAPASPSPTIVKPTTSDGFGAFSGSTGGFSAFAGPKKSFSELLKIGDTDPVKTSTPLAFSTPSSKDVSEKTTPKAVTPSDSSNKKEEDAKDKTPKSVFSVLSAPVGDADVDGTSNAAVPDDDKKQVSTNISSGTISDEPSYGIISGSSAASSFVDIKTDQESDGNAEEDTDEGGEDGVNAFLSEDASSDGSYEDQESAEESSATEDSESGDSPPLEPAAIPLPISRSPSATPQPEIPAIEISPSPPSEEKSRRSSSLSPARDSSTTPPGTPAKVSKPLCDSSSSPTGNVLIPSLSGIGLGRPSTRPARSSPLANAVLPGHDEDDEDKTKSSQPPAVAPNSVFNTLPLKVESSEGQLPADKRPKTPPLSSAMSGTSFFASKSSTAPVDNKVNIPFNFQTSTAPVENPKVNTPVLFNSQKPPAMASPSVFGNSPQVPISGPSLFPPTSAIQRPASAPTPAHSTFFKMPPPSPNASAFSFPPANPQTSTTSIPLTSSPQDHDRPSLFSLNPKSTSGPSSPMGSSSFFAALSQPAPSSQPKAPPAASSSTFSAPQKSPRDTAAQVALEEGMQKECIYSVSLADKELEEMGVYINSARKKFEEVGTSRGGSRYRRDFSDPSKWGLNDLTQFGQVLRQYEGELDNLTAQNETKKQALREIRSNMLKAGTRREEIARFSRVKTDQEFAKILKARTLGPEHSETQMQLRKCIRLVHDRVQKLETGLQEKKKKLAESISGKPSFKAPSLNTINRSYQNIDRIINEKDDQVSDLAARISRLNTKDVANSPQQDHRLGDSGSGRPYNVTPDVAVTTAAALNAERSAQRLKKALLAVRKEPLLNIKAASTPNIRLMTPQKSSNQQPSAFPALLPLSPTTSSSASMLDWTSLPEDNFNPSAVPSPPSRRGGGGGQRKHPSVPLKRSGGPSEASTGPSFDWGPLPNFPTSPGLVKTTVPTAFVPLSTAIKSPLNK